MRIAVCGFKGGIAKSTSAVHLAGVLQNKGETLLIDGDPNRSALAWSERGKGFPFQVVDVDKTSNRFVSQFKHVVVDTEARPNKDDLNALAENCDLIVLPTTPEIMSLHALLQTANALQQLPKGQYRVLLAIVPPKPSRDGEDAREYLQQHHFPLFKGSVRRLSAFQKAALMGRLVKDVPDPRAQFGWNDYVGIGKELLK